MSETSNTSDTSAVAEARELREENVLRVRLGHGANCSSIGSVVDTLFLGATLGGVVFAAICAAMKVEGVTVVGANRGRESGSGSESGSESESGRESESRGGRDEEAP